MNELTKDQRQLKEAMKIILRDGKDGRFFEIAKTRYIALKTEDNINALSHEIEGCDTSKQYQTDISEIETILK